MKNNIFKTAKTMIILSFFSKLLGFLRDYFTATKLGVTIEADAFIMSSNIPNVLFVMLGIAITTTFVPIYNDIKVNSSEEELNKFTSNIINILLGISIVLTIMAECFAPAIVKIMAPGFTNEKFQLTVFLTRILVSAIIINTIVYIFISILQCENRFKMAAAIGIPYNIVLIIYYIFFSDKFGVVGISVMTAVGLVMQAALLVYDLKNVKFNYKFIFNFGDKHLKKMILLFIPIMLGTGMQQINGICNGIFASSLQDGSVASLNYGNKLYTLVVDIIIMSIATVTYQNLSFSASKKDYNDIRKIFNNSIVILFMILIPILAIILFLNVPIIKILFERGKFNGNSTIITANVLSCYSIGLFGAALNTLLSRLCYALNDTKLPMITTTFAVIINVSCAFILKEVMGVWGIALASSIGTVVSSTLLYFIVSNRMKRLFSIYTFKTIIKLICSIIPSCLFLCVCRKYINYSLSIPNQILIVGCISFVSLIIYLTLAYIFKVDEVKESINIVKNEMKRILSK